MDLLKPVYVFMFVRIYIVFHEYILFMWCIRRKDFELNIMETFREINKLRNILSHLTLFSLYYLCRWYYQIYAIFSIFLTMSSKQAGAELCQAQDKLSLVRLDWSNWLNWSNQLTKQNLIKMIKFIKLIELKTDQTAVELIKLIKIIKLIK